MRKILAHKLNFLLQFSFKLFMPRKFLFTKRYFIENRKLMTLISFFFLIVILAIKFKNRDQAKFLV